MDEIRNNWTLIELENLYHQPLLQLLSQAHFVFSKFHPVGEVQVNTLISIKTGGCPEDCKYCSQSSYYQTSTQAQPLMKHEAIMQQAHLAKFRGVTRICLGAAWREIREGKQFEQILQTIRSITALNLEVCCTLGMLNDEQAKKLKEAGLYAYNHNLDSSEGFYKTIITTRSYQDRLITLDIIEKNSISLCCGGIIGMGETLSDRLELLLNLCNRNPHPESFPINQHSAIPGTPLEHQTKISFWEVVKIVAVSRIVLPRAMIRLSAGRIGMSIEQQALCFMAGANSIFIGEKLLTISNPRFDEDEEMLQILGLKKRPAFASEGIK